MAAATMKYVELAKKLAPDCVRDDLKKGSAKQLFESEARSSEEREKTIE